MISGSERLGPLISGETPGLEGELGANINGACPIKAPSWLAERLGRYYLYFAHHNGDHIRLAYADDVQGPWRIYSPGVLHLAESEARGHLASPDVRIDEATRSLELLYHGPLQQGQVRLYPYESQATYLARSYDGINFTPTGKGPIAPPYLRHFDWKGTTYGLCMALDPALGGGRSGLLLRRTIHGAFEPGPRIIPAMRHAAVAVRNGLLEVFFTAVGDVPEHIKYVTVSLAEDWVDWTATGESSLLTPVAAWEGGDLPITGSSPGASKDREHALRDPGYLRDGANEYLFYSGAGERNIGCVRLVRDELADA